jgi:hypothetical protein
MNRLPLLVALSVFANAAVAQPPPDCAWPANAVVGDASRLTVEGLGAAQGVALHAGKVYLYGDVYDVKPRVGVVREYSPDLTPTGRTIWLRRRGEPLLTHPTGLTWDDRFGCFLGDTRRGKAVIYQLDWERALADGDLTNAVRAVIPDDVAVNGCRPEFVTLGGRAYLATADYGDVRPEVRLYDPERLLAAGRSSAPGVVAHRVLAGPFNQMLSWDAATGRLTCVQNVVVGRGWRLDVLDLARAVADGRADGPGVRVRFLTFPPHDELEGYTPFQGRGLFITSSRKDNVAIGSERPIREFRSPAGTVRPDLVPDVGGDGPVEDRSQGPARPPRPD